MLSTKGVSHEDTTAFIKSRFDYLNAVRGAVSVAGLLSPVRVRVLQLAYLKDFTDVRPVEIPYLLAKVPVLRVKFLFGFSEVVVLFEKVFYDVVGGVH